MQPKQKQWQKVACLTCTMHPLICFLVLLYLILTGSKPSSSVVLALAAAQQHAVFDLTSIVCCANDQQCICNHPDPPSCNFFAVFLSMQIFVASQSIINNCYHFSLWGLLAIADDSDSSLVLVLVVIVIEEVLGRLVLWGDGQMV